MTYRTYWDENGDETVELEEGPFPLPANYREQETKLAFLNIVCNDADRRDMPISRSTLHAAVQEVRKCTWGFGDKFKKDPRQFSSLPRSRPSREEAADPKRSSFVSHEPLPEDGTFVNGERKLSPVNQTIATIRSANRALMGGKRVVYGERHKRRAKDWGLA